MRKPHKRIRNRLGCHGLYLKALCGAEMRTRTPTGFQPTSKKIVNQSQNGHVLHGLFDFFLQKDNLQNTTFGVGPRRSTLLPFLPSYNMIPTPGRKTIKKGATVARNPLELLVAGTGFEPVTLGL